MPDLAQARLLRALESRSVRPVGSDESFGFDVRLIASTRLSLEDLRRRPGIRQDFFYRVQGDVLEIPPLRERRDDIPELFRQLLEMFCNEAGIPIPAVDPRVEDLLRDAAWPGNVRELQNEVRRVLVERPLRITRHDFAGITVAQAARDPSAETSVVASEEKNPAEGGDDVLTLQEARSRAEREVVTAALRRCRGNATTAARSLGVSRRHLGTLLSRYALNPLDFR